MPLSFLYPLLWLGLAALAIPLWLHLKRKRESNLVRFSAVQFLEDQPRARKAPLRLRDAVLLAMRALALVLLIAAFAWPYLPDAKTLPIEASRVYILDNTLSQQAGDNFNRSRARIISEIQSANRGIQSAVIELRSEPRRIVEFGDTPDEAVAKLRGLQPSYERGSYLAALRQAGGLLGESFGERRKIIFLGDGQKNQWEEDASTPPFLPEMEVELPAARDKSLPNIALHEPRGRRVFAGDRSVVHFSATLNQAGATRPARVVVRANGQTVLERECPTGGQATVLQAQWEANPDEWIAIEATIEGAQDALPADDRVFFAVPPLREGRVLVLADSPYLRTALAPEVMKGSWAAEFGSTPQAGSRMPGGSEADVLCVEAGYLKDPAGRDLARRFLESGRGVVLFANSLTPAVEGYLRELDFTTSPVAPVNEGAEPFKLVVFKHAVFEPFASPDYGDLMQVKMHRYARVQSRDAVPLLFSQQGTPLLLECARMGGRLFVVPFGMDRGDTSWPVHPTFVPFIDLLLQAAAGGRGEVRPFHPAQRAEVELPRGHDSADLFLFSGEKQMFPVQRVGDRVALTTPESPGLYSVRNGRGAPLVAMMAVNPPPKESELAYAERPPEPAAWIDRHAVSGEAIGARKSWGNPAILQQRIWWWMLVGVVAALAGEMAIAAMKKERSA
jgi:hypothetical protein